MSNSVDAAKVVRTWFLVHRHQTARSHFDLRIRTGDLFRNWSLLKEPPIRAGDQRLAVERETIPAQAADQEVFDEQAFGSGRAQVWDGGEVEVSIKSPRQFELEFHGARMRGRYEMRRTRWYPGNRWLLKRLEGCAPTRQKP